MHVAEYAQLGQQATVKCDITSTLLVVVLPPTSSPTLHQHHGQRTPPTTPLPYMLEIYKVIMITVIRL